MTPDHEQYQVQAALAAAGQLTPAEQSDLEQHASTCPACRDCMADMATISRELFLLQAARIKPVAAPAGTRRRFLARAGAAGIPLNRTARASRYPEAIPAAALAVLLAMSLSMTWRVFSAHGPDANALPGTLTAQSSLEPAFEKSTPLATQPRLLQHASLRKPRLRPRSAWVQHDVANPSADSTGEPRRSYFDLEQPLFARHTFPASSTNEDTSWSASPAANPLAANLLASARTSFPSANGAKCFGIGETGEPEERACHLDIKLAALSSFDAPHKPDFAPDFTPLKLNPRIVHLTPNSVQ